VHRGEQRELRLQPLGLQHIVHLSSCLGSLQLLTIQHLGLQLGYRLLASYKCLRHLPIPATIAGGDQVSHTTGFKVSAMVATRVKSVAILHHLLQPEPDGGRES